MGFTCLFFAFLTAFGVHNFFKYIIKQQYQLILLYVFAILAAFTRLCTYLYMIINYIRGNEVHTVLFMQIDLVVSSVIIAVGLCLSLITLKLYTIM